MAITAAAVQAGDRDGVLIVASRVAGVLLVLASALAVAEGLADEPTDPEAQFNLGRSYAAGLGVPQDHVRAVFWWRKAAEQGHGDAQVGLARAYWGGLGVPQDHIRAVFWYRKAAEQGDPGGQVGLARAYWGGLGVPQDRVRAVFWYRKAAEQGDPGGQAALGTSYLLGEDYVRAYAWFSLAAGQGRTETAAVRDGMLQMLTPAQLAEAQALSRELWKRYVVPFQSAPGSED